MKRAQLSAVTVLAAFLLSTPPAAGGPFPPDLQIQSMSAPASAVAGAEIQVAVRFINRGVGGADSFMAELWLEEQVIGRPPLVTTRWRVRNLSPGDDVLERRVLRVPATLAAGAYSLRVYADRGLAVSESDEANNVSVRSIQVTATSAGPTPPPQAPPAGPGTMLAPPRDLRVDLAVTGMIPSSNAGPPGYELPVYSQVFNCGNTATVPSSVSLALRPRQGPWLILQTAGVPRLSPGQRHDVYLRVRLGDALAPGRYTLVVKVDSDNAFTETDERNNEATAEFSVLGPDLAGTGYLQVTPGSVSRGGLVSVSATIRNAGSADASSAPYRLVLSASRSLESPRLLRQSPGETPLRATETRGLSSALADVALPGDLAAGTYYLAIQLDPDGRVAEENERNNTFGPLALVVTP